MKSSVAIAGIVLVATTLMCAAPQSKGPLSSEADFVGFITAIDRTGTGSAIAVIAVESHAGKMVHRHRVTVTRDTTVLRRDGDSTRPIDLGALEIKDWVRLWFSDSGRKAYPPDVTARQLLVVDRP